MGFAEERKYWGADVQKRWIWAVTAMGMYVVILLISDRLAGAADGASIFIGLYAACYGVFGALLLGAVARWWRSGSPALWRPFMLSVGSLAAVLQIALISGHGFGSAAIDRWMVALFGLLVAALLARLLPIRLVRHWLSLERRQHDIGA
jgi:hypothetical protein